MNGLATPVVHNKYSVLALNLPSIPIGYPVVGAYKIYSELLQIGALGSVSLALPKMLPLNPIAFHAALVFVGEVVHSTNGEIDGLVAVTGLFLIAAGTTLVVVGS